MRIATSQIHALASLDLQRAQADLFEAQRQTGSERKAADLKGYAKDAGALVNARSYRDLSESFVAAATTVSPRLELQSLTLGETANSAQSVRLAMTEAVGLDSGSEMMAAIELAFQTAVSSLNVTYGGSFIYGGVRDDQAPVTVTSLDDLAALPAAADAFQNAPRRATVKLDVNVTLDVAPVASEVAGDLFDAFKRIKDYEIANGPFAGDLTPAQRTFLETEIGQLAQVVDNIHAYEAQNGGVQQRVASILERQADQQSYFEQVVQEVEGVNLAEVASRLSQADLQLKASAQVYAQLRGSSLLNVL